MSSQCPIPFHSLDDLRKDSRPDCGAVPVVGTTIGDVSEDDRGVPL